MTKIDPQKMMAQLGKMQEQMAQAQEELKTSYVEHSAGGGAVTVKASGALEIADIRIKPEAIDPDDPEMLQDLLVSAVNGAIAAAQQLQQQKMMGQLAGPADWAGSAFPGCRLFAPSVDNLIVQLARLPGVGRRTAQRLAFHLLKASEADALALADAIREVKERIGFCTECGNLAEEPLCPICADARRDRSLICVVEDPSDLVALERTHEYRGLYHVLGGALSPIDGVDPEHLRIAELVARVETGGVVEVLLATNPTMTGEATAAYLADRLRGHTRVTRLASGLPVGGDLEYADEVTLGRALAGRREM